MATQEKILVYLYPDDRRKLDKLVEVMDIKAEEAGKRRPKMSGTIRILIDDACLKRGIE